MTAWTRRFIFTGILLITWVVPTHASQASDAVWSQPLFEGAWERLDKPVAERRIARTWMWGPLEIGVQRTEPYREAPGGQRVVRYFDKSRMEITDPAQLADDEWSVTNGLLVVELVSGRMQVGDDAFVDLGPAEINIAGDPDDPSGLTYAVVGSLLQEPARPAGTSINQRVDQTGHVSIDDALAEYGVTAAHDVPETSHTVASPFWTFIQGSGLVYEDGQYQHGDLFDNPFYATGYPITEGYWARVKVGGSFQDVLMQCFERRCLTYTPSNPAEWRVEVGNVGQHYYQWRYQTTFEGGSGSLSFDTLVIGAASGGSVAAPALLIATSEAQRDELAARVSAEDRPVVEQADLNVSILVGILLDTKPTSGHGIELIAMQTQQALLEVTVEIRAPAPDAVVRFGYETPYHVVQVRRDAIEIAQLSAYRVVDQSGNVLVANPFDPADATMSQASGPSGACDHSRTSP